MFGVPEHPFTGTGWVRRLPVTGQTAGGVARDYISVDPSAKRNRIYFVFLRDALGLRHPIALPYFAEHNGDTFVCLDGEKALTAAAAMPPACL